MAALAQRANTSVVCTSCHQDGFIGDGTQPRLAGQERAYLEKTMTDFRSGARGNNPGMTDSHVDRSRTRISRRSPPGWRGCEALSFRGRGPRFGRCGMTITSPSTSPSRRSFAARSSAVLPSLSLQRAVGAALQKKRRGRSVAERGGDHQRGAAAIVGGVERRAVREQKIDDPLERALRRRPRRGRRPTSAR